AGRPGAGPGPRNRGRCGSARAGTAPAPGRPGARHRRDSGGAARPGWSSSDPRTRSSRLVLSLGAGATRLAPGLVSSHYRPMRTEPQAGDYRPDPAILPLAPWLADV